MTQAMIPTPAPAAIAIVDQRGDQPADFARSESIAQLCAALAAAQGDIASAAKDRENPHFQQAYATLASVWNACRSALSKNGLAVIQPVTVAGKRVKVTTLLTHKSGEWIRSDLMLEALQPGVQAIGGIITYGRRYGLSAMVGVAPEDDDGEEETTAPQRFSAPQGPRSTPPPTAAKPAARPPSSAPPPAAARPAQARIDKAQAQVDAKRQREQGDPAPASAMAPRSAGGPSPDDEFFGGKPAAPPAEVVVDPETGEVRPPNETENRLIAAMEGFAARMSAAVTQADLDAIGRDISASMKGGIVNEAARKVLGEQYLEEAKRIAGAGK